MPLQESGEMYLETIFILSKEISNVRSIDICEYMGYSKPSVSRAVGLLKNGGYIIVDKDGYITLTSEGLEIAENIYERHNILTDILTYLGVDKQIASEDACRIEHVISNETFEALKSKHKDIKSK
ncbi:MAG: metal-dependent transcriptional regulator [Clostridia bacterium]|nr:metal-dependent transcriptional regulator [Clostridia bacterium]